ncbi:hypothetical protein SEA_ZUKO_82 [Streptomyces phage Zuko]|uniref:Uncharacterized protein n=1 Tax=Streptomyces phage Zuko TaxID=2601695 RepID=A0A5J6D746_9CAUD|nr:hypothetical protein PP630_gp082 [Streptomyces phage Zuko]QEQ93660.1 hypothetical protein SEA_ZUKO_82 [Streptomyces phage Zuko]
MATKQTIDFSQTKDQSGFNPKRKQEGEYLGTIVSFEDTKSKAGAAMWVYGVALKTDRRAVYPVYCLLGADQVWKLRNLMMAAGFKVPKKRMQVDGNRLVGKDIGIFLEDDEYEGKPKSVIGSFFPASEYSGPENEDDDQDEDEEYEEDDTVPEDDDEESEDEDTEDETDEESDDSDEDDSDDEDTDEDDEPEDAPPAKKATAKKSAPARAKAKKPAPVEEDEDEMDVEDL